MAIRKISTSHLEAQIRGLNSEIGRLNGRINNYENAKKEIDKTVAKLKEIRGTLNDGTKFKSTRATTIAGEVDDAIIDLNATKGKINTCISNLRTQISQCESQIESLRSEIRAAQLEI